MSKKETNFIYEQIEREIKSRLPYMVKNVRKSIQESNTEPGEINELFGDMATQARLQKLADLRDLEDGLHGQYGKHLRIQPQLVKEILTEYPTSTYPKPSGTYTDPSGNVYPTPNYGILLDKWEKHDDKFQKRRSLTSQITALHVQVPSLRRLAGQIEDHRSRINRSLGNP